MEYNERYTIEKETEKTLCNWCNKESEYKIIDAKIEYTDHACKEHTDMYFINK